MDHAEFAVDLSGFMPEDTAKMEVMKPGGTEGTGWTITFAGPGHLKTVTFGATNARKNLRRQQQIEAAQVNGKKFKPEDREVDEVRRENVSFVVARIVDWTPVRLGPGEPIRFTDEAASELLMRPTMAWAFAQMLEFLADERSFTKGSATTSEPSPSATSL